MGLKVDLDELVGAGEVASLLGLSGRTAVSVYRERYADFPSPVLARGTCFLWLRADFEDWSTQRRPGR